MTATTRALGTRMAPTAVRAPPLWLAASLLRPHWHSVCAALPPVPSPLCCPGRGPRPAATVPQGPTKEEQNGASAERQPQAVAPFHGVAPFAGNQLNTAAFFGSPHPRGWGEDNLAADLPLARVQGDFGEVKTALAALAAATGPPSSHTCDLPPVPPQGTGALCRSPPPPPPTPPARSRRGHFPPRDQGLP